MNGAVPLLPPYAFTSWSSTTLPVLDLNNFYLRSSVW